jgi:hypothetical protein
MIVLPRPQTFIHRTRPKSSVNRPRYQHPPKPSPTSSVYHKPFERLGILVWIFLCF